MAAVVKAAPPQPDLVEINDLAAGIARTQAADLIAGLSATKRKTIRSLIVRAIEQGWSDTTLRNRIKQTAGLSPRDATALENYRRGLTAQNVAPGRLERMVEAYAKRLRNSRAALIARTETRQTLMEAQRQVWRHMQQTGDLSPYAVRVTRVNKDERLCAQCGSQNGRRRSLKTNDGPPFHPNCRCWEDIEDQGIEKAEPRDADKDGWVYEGTTRKRRKIPTLPKNPTILDDFGISIDDAIKAQDAYPEDTWNAIGIMATHKSPSVRGAAMGMIVCAAKYPHIAAHLNRLNWTGMGMPSQTAYGHTSVGDAAGFKQAVIGFNPNTMPRYLKHGADLVEYGLVDSEERGGFGIAVHEFGHLAGWHAAKTYITEKYGWKEAWNAQVYIPRALNEWADTMPTVSPYAARNHDEAFAEWFTADWFGIKKPGVAGFSKFIKTYLEKPWPPTV